MNGTYFKTPEFPNNINNDDSQIRNNNIYYNNIGKKVKIYVTFKGSTEWLDRLFSGIIEGTEEDNIIMSDPGSGSWYLIPQKYVDYIEFEEKINT